MARPKKAATDKREHHIGCYLTDEEAARLHDRVQQAGVSVSDYLRRTALTGKVVVRQDTAHSFAVANQLRRIGANLNQITHSIHINGGRIPPDLERLCHRMEQALDRVFADGSALKCPSDP